MIVVVDYGMGNLGSIVNMIKKIGYKCIVTSNLEEIKNATKLILPGIGSFDNGMRNLEQLNMLDVLNQKVMVDKTPILGICLGMQLMTKNSEEGRLAGFGWIDAETKKFVSDTFLIWGGILSNIKKYLNFLMSEKRFYFVHSYCVRCTQKNDILTSTNYTQDFVSSFEKENVIGVQFHPEKSHKFGMSLIKNFLENY